MRQGMCRVLVGSIAAWTAISSAAAQNPGKQELLEKLAPKQQINSRALFLESPPAAAGRQIQVLPATQGLPSANIRVQFEYNSRVLTAEGQAALKPLGEALQDPSFQGFRFLIAGHTDAKGSDKYNDDLSARRAAAVRDHLIKTYGIQPDRLAAQGFRKRQLLDPSKPEDPINRRVEVVNLGSAVGAAGAPSGGPSSTAAPPR